MDCFLKRTHSELEPASSTSSASRPSESTSKAKAKSKSRKYEASYIEFGFVLTKKKDGLDYPKCVLCQEILSNECLKPSKLKRHLEQKHPNDFGKHMDFFKRKAALLTKQASVFTQQVTARLHVENDMRLLLNQLKPRMDKLRKNVQAHPSH